MYHKLVNLYALSKQEIVMYAETTEKKFMRAIWKARRAIKVAMSMASYPETVHTMSNSNRLSKPLITM